MRKRFRILFLSAIACVYAAGKEPADLDGWFSLFDGIHSHVPGERLSVAACAFSLEESPDAVWRFVRHRIRYVPYRGIVKGPAGVLLSGEGNSLEQALLLAHLLKQKGYAVKLCRGGLADEKQPALEKHPASSSSVSAAEERACFAKLGLPASLFVPFAEKRKKEARTRLDLLAGRAAMRCRSLKRFIPDRAGSVRGESDHYWVKAAVSVEAWRDLDPVCAEKAGQSVADEDEAYTLEELPDHLFARFSLKLLLQAGKQKTELLSFSGRFADYAMKPLQLAFVPAGFSVSKDKSAAVMWREFAEAKRYVAVLNAGGTVILGNSFSSDGAVFKGTGDGRIDAAKRLGGGLGGLFGGAGGQGAKAAQAWKIILEGETERCPAGGGFKRLLFAREPETPPFGLLSTFTYLLVPGPVCDAFFTRSYLANLLDNEPLVRQWVSSPVEELFKKLKPYPADVYAFAHALPSLCDSFFPAGDAAAPFVFLGYESRVLGSDGKKARVQEGYDILSCPLVFADRSAHKPFQWGVALTELERLLVEEKHDTDVLSAPRLFLQAQAEGIALRKLTKAAELSAVAKPQREALAEEIAAGNTVIIPEKPLSWGGREVLPYYAIDADTGVCLGKIARRGQAATEYLEKIDMLMSVVGAIDSYSKFMMCITAAVISPLSGKSKAQARADFAQCFTEWAMGALFSGAKGFFNISPTAANMAADAAVGGVPGSPWGGFTGWVSKTMGKGVSGQ